MNPLLERSDMARVSYGITCHLHTNRTYLYSPAAERHRLLTGTQSLCLPTGGWLYTAISSCTGSWTCGLTSKRPGLAPNPTLVNAVWHYHTFIAVECSKKAARCRVLTILCTAAEQIEYVAMATDHLHYFHLLDEIGQLAVRGIVFIKQTVIYWHRKQKT